MGEISISKQAPQCLQESLPKVKDDQKGIIYEIGAKWCGPCKEFKSYYESAEGQKSLSKYAFKMVDFDEDKKILQCLNDYGIINQNHVMMPLYLLFRPDGSFIAPYLGFASQSDFVQGIDILYKQDQEQPPVQNGK